MPQGISSCGSSTEMSTIDPREFGALETKVDKLEKSVEALTNEVRTLVALANQGKGAYWAGMFIASGLGAGIVSVVKLVLR